MSLITRNLKPRKLYLFERKKNKKVILKTFYHKILTMLLRKGLRQRYIRFFYLLLRLQKQRLKFFCQKKYKSDIFSVLPQGLKIPTFPIIIRVVLRIITLKLELRFRKFRKKEILIPVPISPWRGARLGLNILFKHAKTRIEKQKVPRKEENLHRLLNEIWDTFHKRSATCKELIVFMDKVVDNYENFRSARLFPVRLARRFVIPLVLRKVVKKKKKSHKV